MSKYINADELSKKLGRFVEYSDDGEQEINPDAVFITIDEMPSADVVEVEHGEWQYDCACDLFNCSYCGSYMARNVYPYCPWCGADMRERKETE